MQGRASAVCGIGDTYCLDSASERLRNAHVSSRHDSNVHTLPTPGETHHHRQWGPQQTLTRPIAGEVAKWEHRLKSSQERLHVMRMERAQWHAMVHASERKKRQAQTQGFSGGVMVDTPEDAVAARSLLRPCCRCCVLLCRRTVRYRQRGHRWWNAWRYDAHAMYPS